MYLMQYLHQNTLFCWFSLETSRIGNINLKRREICHIPLPEAHVEWDHCDPDILSGLLVYVAQLKPGVVLFLPRPECVLGLERRLSSLRKHQELVEQFMLREKR